MKYGIINIIILMLLAGCTQPRVESKNINETNETYVVQQTYIPPPPRKKLKLKEIQDSNFNADYMYPEDNRKKIENDSNDLNTTKSTETLGKKECIAMISQEKFDKYAAMFGSEDASIKRCKMLKATR